MGILYIGQTGRNFDIRINEYKKATEAEVYAFKCVLYCCTTIKNVLQVKSVLLKTVYVIKSVSCKT